MKKASKLIACIMLAFMVLASSFVINPFISYALGIDVYLWDDFLFEINYMIDAPKTEFTKAEAIYLTAVFTTRGLVFKDSPSAYSFAKNYWDNVLPSDWKTSLRYAIKTGRYDETTNTVICDVPGLLWENVSNYLYDNYKDYAGQGGINLDGSIRILPDGFPDGAISLGHLSTVTYSKNTTGVIVTTKFKLSVINWFDVEWRVSVEELNSKTEEYVNIRSLPVPFGSEPLGGLLYYIPDSNVFGYYWFYHVDGERQSGYVPIYTNVSIAYSDDYCVVDVGNSIADSNYDYAESGKQRSVAIPLSNTGTPQDFFNNPDLGVNRDTPYSEAWEGIVNDLFPDGTNPIDEYGLNPIKDNFSLLMSLIDRKLGYIPSNLKAVFNELGAMQAVEIPNITITFAGQTHTVVNNEYLNKDILPTARVWFEGVFWIFYSLYLWRQIISLLRGIDPTGPFGHKNVGGGGKAIKEGKGE